jgi:hypothetical protein
VERKLRLDCIIGNRLLRMLSLPRRRKKEHGEGKYGLMCFLRHHLLLASLIFRAMERLGGTYVSTPALEITRFCLSFNGLNFVGIDSHVLRPMITAFCPS